MSLQDDLLQDMAEIFESEEVSTTAMVTPAAGGLGWTLDGKFRSPYRAEQFGSMEVGGQDYTFLVLTAVKDAGGLQRGDVLTIEGADYKHIEPQDGTPTAGMSLLQLAPL